MSQVSYRGAWAQYSAWCTFFGYGARLKCATTTSNAEQLGAFAVYLWCFGMNRHGTGNTYSTICGKLCAVRWYHKGSLGYDPGVNASHAILLRDIRRFTNQVVKQQPITACMLRSVHAACDLSRTRGQPL